MPAALTVLPRFPEGKIPSCIHALADNLRRRDPLFQRGCRYYKLGRSRAPTSLFCVVVDDGSVDNTAALTEAAGAVVACHECNRGKGVALKTGLSQTLKQGFEWAVTLDGDGQHSPEDLPALLLCAQETGALLVIGNRMHDAGTMPWLRRQVNRWMSRKISQRVGRRLPDMQSGFRIIHLRTWATMALNTEHFEVESEMLMAFLAAEHPVAFTPIQVVSRSRSSHIHPVKDSLRWWRWWRGLKRAATSPA
jgi:glycosyltransferase involved in cell wall biosynthesis